MPFSLVAEAKTELLNYIEKCDDGEYPGYTPQGCSHYVIDIHNNLDRKKKILPKSSEGQGYRVRHNPCGPVTPGALEPFHRLPARGCVRSTTSTLIGQRCL